jgi:hypothetical protein
VGGDALGALTESPRCVRIALPELPVQDIWACGDMVRWRHDGSLDFVGRRDAELKIRGMRVEPAEIESVLMEHEAVREAALLAWPEPGGTLRLVAYVAPAGAAPSAAELRAFMARHLPAPMVPSQFVFIERLPHTGSGKIDRESLRRRGDPVATVLPAAATAPRSESEQAVAAVWSELLGRPVGIEDNFFAVGGHSLLAAQAISRLQQRLGVRLELRRLFEAPTVAGLAAVVDEAQRGDAARFEPIPRAARRAHRVR